MGAETFFEIQAGSNATDAFNTVVDNASHEHGHGGYTGTIAEKYEFLFVVCPEDVEPMFYVEQIMDDDNHFTNDKWGPAGCIDLKNGTYLFFGSASS